MTGDLMPVAFELRDKLDALRLGDRTSIGKGTTGIDNFRRGNFAAEYNPLPRPFDPWVGHRYRR